MTTFKRKKSTLKPPTYYDQGKLFKNARAGESERLFQHISNRALLQGLQVNTKKTTLLAVSETNSYEVDLTYTINHKHELTRHLP